ncbi:MAG: right-handed parallel beta-helix repeat-containing protein [Pseudomonadota bacterium]
MRLLHAAAVVVLAAGLLATARAAGADSVGCGSTVTTDTTLGRDLLGCPGDGLVVAGDGVTIDLAGHAITGLGQGAGIRILGSRVVVRDGSVEGFGMGIWTNDYPVSRPSETTIVRVKVRRNIGFGVVFSGVGETLEDSTVAFNGGDGVLLSNSDGSTVRGNKVFRNRGNGISGRPHADGARYVANDVSENGGDGIEMSESLALAVTDNVASRNGGNGVRILESTPSFPPLYVIARNVADDNGGHGIQACWYNDLGGNPCDDGFTDGGGNAAKHNGVEPQCVNVACTSNRARS